MSWECCDECHERIKSARAYNDRGQPVHPSCRVLAHAEAGTVRQPRHEAVYQEVQGEGARA